MGRFFVSVVAVFFCWVTNSWASEDMCMERADYGEVELEVMSLEVDEVQPFSEAELEDISQLIRGGHLKRASNLLEARIDVASERNCFQRINILINSLDAFFFMKQSCGCHVSNPRDAW